MAALPSPAASPSLETMSRKRVRSASSSSMDSASSPKRAVSEVPSCTSDNGAPSPHPMRSESLARLTIKPDSLDIDNYMSEQEQGTPGANEASTSTHLLPQEKLSIIGTLKRREMVEGETWYVVDHSWYRRWEIACTGLSEKGQQSVSEASIGSVDNSAIADSEGNIIVTPTEGLNVDYLPQPAWEHFEQWYGTCARPLPRAVITQGIARETRLELFPLKLTVFLLFPGDRTTLVGPRPRTLSLSKKVTVGELISRITRIFGVFTGEENTRYWLVQGSSQNDKDECIGMHYPTGRLKQDRAKLFITTDSTKTLEDALVESGDAFVVERKSNAEWLFNETPQASRSVTPLFGSGSGQDFFSKLSASTSKSSVKSENNDANDTLTPKASGFGITRNFAPSSKPPGTTGLVNLGNTCFMNSAIQCLAHEPELTEYFLTGLFRDELNPNNPLGMQGAVAEAFGALLSRLWVQNTTSLTSAYSPREFKQVLARFAPSFSGYQQHDAQELLAFLLDGLHEDLNRILKKPYVEKPEWEGGGEQELIDLAKKSWDGYMLRNDSVIVDLFQGQYKSTLVCPECSKVSITFDPFMYLTLPLPIHRKWKHSIYFVPWDLSKPHVSIPLELSQQATFKELKLLLGRWMEVRPENLLTLEIWSSKFYKNLPDATSVQEIAERDTVVCFELPCNAQQSRNFQRSPNDPMIIPVFHTTSKASGSRPSYNTYSTTALFGNPFVIVIPPKDGRTVGRLYELVIERLSRWTSNDRDLYSWQGMDDGVSIEPVIPVSASTNSLTEIRESGEVVTIEESDITDMSHQVVDQPEEIGDPLRRLGPKPDIFKLILHAATPRTSTATCDKSDPLDNPVSWKTRILQKEGGSSEEHPSPDGTSQHALSSLLDPRDWLVCEWDIHKQAYFFGEERHFEHARWNHFDELIHPEYEAVQKDHAGQKGKSLNLEDCLDEFTKEEQLGEDDLWYCPRCKKHQQATKKFDIWKVPDVLVVHLKRFSSSRILRDKIDVLVDFPLESLDLEGRVEERRLTRKLREESEGATEVGDLDEPLLYDLFGVTEHMGGLGGGHYRAYAKNHLDENWYHFDDSHVYKTDARNAINQNAYLLFYRRRATKPLGGKTHEKVKTAQQNVIVSEPEVMGQLPTPPDEGSPPTLSRRSTQPLPDLLDDSVMEFPPNMSLLSSSLTPSSDDYEFNDVADIKHGDDESHTLRRYPTIIDFDSSPPFDSTYVPGGSPTSSNEVEVDSDHDDSVSLRSTGNDSSPSPFAVGSPISSLTSIEVSPSDMKNGFSLRLGQTEPHGDVDDIDL